MPILYELMKIHEKIGFFASAEKCIDGDGLKAIFETVSNESIIKIRDLTMS